MDNRRGYFVTFELHLIWVVNIIFCRELLENIPAVNDAFLCIYFQEGSFTADLFLSAKYCCDIGQTCIGKDVKMTYFLE